MSPAVLLVPVVFTMVMVLLVYRAVLGIGRKVDNLTTPQRGRCGDRLISILGRWSASAAPTCSLTAGHAGWHKDRTTGAEWSAKEAVGQR